MKTKNVKVRVKDLKAGVTIYRAHPVYGIEHMVVTGRPYMSYGMPFFPVMTYGEQGSYSNYTSIRDAGMIGHGYNGRRTFFKLKHAEEWVRKWKTDKGFIRQHTQHVKSCETRVSDFVAWGL